jgi:hypothetical protein
MPSLDRKIWARQRLARRNDDGGRRGDGLCTLIAECADTRQAAIGYASQGWSSQHEGEGEEESKGSHWTVSGFLPALPAVVACEFVTVRRFRRFASRSKMGFVPLENCFVATIKRNILTKTSVISMIAVGHWASFGRSLA